MIISELRVAAGGFWGDAIPPYIEWSIKVINQSIPLKFTGLPSESVT